MSAREQTRVGLCRRCRTQPRRMRRGMVEPLCQQCYEAALGKVAAELADEQEDAKRRWAGKASKPPQPATPAPEEVPSEPVQAEALAGQAPSRARGPGRPTLIGEAALTEARRLYGLGLSLRAVAESVLEDTGYANAESAAVALGRQFKKHGWTGQRQHRRRVRSSAERSARAA